MKGIDAKISILSKLILLVVIVLIPLGCTSKKDENAPLAPGTPASFSVTPTSAQVVKGGGQSFIQKGGVGTVTWAVSDTSLATINASTGVLIAGKSTGTVTVTATDSSGRKAASTVSIVDNKIIVWPATLTLSALGQQTAAFTAYGAVGAATYTLTGNTNNYKGATISSSGVLTLTAWPTATQGTQTLTITVSDGISTAGTATVTLPVSDTNLIVSPATLTIGLLSKVVSSATVNCDGTVCSVLYKAVTSSGLAPAGTIFYNLSGATNGYTGAVIATATGVLVVTLAPTAAQGDQTLTVTASDGFLTGTATLTLTVN